MLQCDKVVIEYAMKLYVVNTHLFNFVLLCWLCYVTLKIDPVWIVGMHACVCVGARGC